MSSVAQLCALLLMAISLDQARAVETPPSRPPVQRCAWERLADRTVGLAAWVQRCDFGFRQIHFEFVRGALAIRYSDGGSADPLVEILDILPGEATDAALKRVFSERTEKAISQRCELAPYTGTPSPAAVERFTFVLNAAYRNALEQQADPNEVADPPCGAWGEAPDGIQYFEVSRQDPRKLLFVRVGQDEPLFDEQTLQILPPG